MKLIKEPLLHFFVLALFLFVLEAAFSSSQKEKIIINQQTADFLIKQREDLVMHKLSDVEQGQIIASYIEDEILYSEAYKRGLDKGDSRMRRNLILKMRGLLNGDIKEPAEEQLRAFYEANRENYTRPASVSLDHVFYSEQTLVPENTLEQLRSGVDHTTLGESRLGHAMPNLIQSDLVARFGGEGAQAILASNNHQWHGPFESAQGLHFVRIIERTVEQQLSYEEMAPYLETEWIVEQSRKAVQQEINRVKINYEIVIQRTLEDEKI